MGALKKENQFAEIEKYIKKNISKWLADVSMSKPPQVYEIELRERMIRVEEELKHQRELMMKGFENSDKRFEAMQTYMDKHFNAITKRIDRFMIWSFGLTITTSGLIIAFLKFGN